MTILPFTLPISTITLGGKRKEQLLLSNILIGSRSSTASATGSSLLLSKTRHMDGFGGPTGPTNKLERDEHA